MKQRHKPSLSCKDKEKRRLKAGKMFDKDISQAEIARKLKVTPTAVNQWHKTWDKGGSEALKSIGSPGPESELTLEKSKKFKKAILKGPEAYGYETNLWTLPRLRSVMKKINKIDFSEVWIWHIVRDLGFTPQKPQVKAKQRNEKAITEWKEKTLPGLKKMGQEKRILPGF
jgi:transposase